MHLIRCLALLTAPAVIQAQSFRDVVASRQDLTFFKRTLDNDPLLSELYYNATNLTCFIGSDVAYNRYNPIPSVTAFLNNPLAQRQGWLYSCVHGLYPSSVFSSRPAILRSFLDEQRTVPNFTVGTIQPGGMPMIVGKYDNGTVYARSAPRDPSTGIPTLHSGPFQESWVTEADIPFDGGILHVTDDLFDYGTDISIIDVGRIFQKKVILDFNSTGKIGPSFFNDPTTFITTTNSSYEKYKQLPDDQRKIISDYLPVSSVYFSDSFTEAGNNITTSNGLPMTLSIRGGDYYVNDCKVILSDIIIVNGVDHFVECYPVPLGSGIPTGY